MNLAPRCLSVDWPAPAGIRAAFSTRCGGLGQAPFASLNLGTHVGDDPLTVAANRAALRAELQLVAEPCWLDQIHSDILIDLDHAVIMDVEASTAVRQAEVTPGASL